MNQNIQTSERQGTGWASFIGIVICLCGNLIISFALNIQRLAHERIQTKLNAQQQTRHIQSQVENIEDVPKDNDEGTRYLKSHLWWTGLVLMCIGEIGNFVACIFPL
jgi:hypothetical protein